MLETDRLRERVASLMPQLTTDLERLIRLPSISFAGYSPETLRQTAIVVADLVLAAGMPQVELLEVPDAPPVVFAARPAPPGAPTVLLYAHYDIQPAGDESHWTSPPFQPVERDGRLYGRGACDDKSGVMIHIGALQAVGPDLPIGLKVLIEGQEEVGFGGLEDYVVAHPDLVAADALVIADAGNKSLGVPTLSTSLRGLTAVDLEVQTIERNVHSGAFGGVAPDALIALMRICATLHDEAGNVAVAGLERVPYEGAEYDEHDYRVHAGVLPGVGLIGDGGVAERLFARPAINVIGVDAPDVDHAGNCVLPRARARISVRLAPSQSPEEAQQIVIRHLLAAAPWGVRATAVPAGTGEGFLGRTDGPAFRAAEEAMGIAFEREVVHFGQGGAIPIVAALHRALPEAEMILWGAGEPSCRVHGPDESVDLGELRRCVLAEAIFLAKMAG